MDTKPLRWALLVPTYNRRKALRTSLELAITQTRPPHQIVIVDASPDFHESREQMFDEVAPLRRDVHFRHEPARVRACTAQRNQAMELARGDVFFMLDDDSFMYPDCAERVMEIYDADRHERVVGVGARELPLSPVARARRPRDHRPRAHTRVESSAFTSARDRLRSLFAVERVLLPYDSSYPEHPIPPEVAHFDVAATHYLGGMRMTWRAGWARHERFDETLQKYAAAEDMDFSYRMSRHGVLLNALSAHLHHAQDASARLTTHTRTLLGLLNLAYLYRRNGYDPARMFQRYRRRLIERLALDAVRDLLRLRTSMPYARADARALVMLEDILAIEERELPRRYGELQSQILAANAA